MFKKVIAVFAVLMAAFLLIVALQPSDFRVSRSIEIAAPGHAVFDYVNDLRKFDAWSPWLEPDPAVQKTFSGPSAGQGAVFGWSGNKEVGEGKMTITESRPHELIRMELEFVRPMEGNSQSIFTFEPRGPGTAVTWTMFGHNNFLAKAICLFMNSEKMVGGQFEKGLAKLKAAAEGK